MRLSALPCGSWSKPMPNCSRLDDAPKLVSMRLIEVFRLSPICGDRVRGVGREQALAGRAELPPPFTRLGRC